MLYLALLLLTCCSPRLQWAVGPFFLGPLSEIHGRVHILQISNLFFLAWNLGCAFARNNAEIIVFRFLAGLGGSAQLAAGGGVLADCWRPEQRGKAMAIYTLAPILGPAFGPIIGGWIAERSTWRWVFWATSIADVVVQSPASSLWPKPMRHRSSSKRPVAFATRLAMTACTTSLKARSSRRFSKSLSSAHSA